MLRAASKGFMKAPQRKIFQFIFILIQLSKMQRARKVTTPMIRVTMLTFNHTQPKTFKSLNIDEFVSTC